MAAAIARAREVHPPRPVVWAVILTVINAVVGIIFSIAWPDLDDRGTVVTVSIVLGLLMIAAALWLWTGARWGAIATLAVNAFNILLGIPGFFGDDGSIIAGLVVSIVLSAAAIVLLLTTEAKAFWNRRPVAQG